MKLSWSVLLMISGSLQLIIVAFGVEVRGGRGAGVRRRPRATHLLQLLQLRLELRLRNAVLKGRKLVSLLYARREERTLAVELVALKLSDIAAEGVLRDLRAEAGDIAGAGLALAGHADDDLLDPLDVPDGAVSGVEACRELLEGARPGLQVRSDAQDVERGGDELGRRSER